MHKKYRLRKGESVLEIFVLLFLFAMVICFVSLGLSDNVQGRVSKIADTIETASETAAGNDVLKNDEARSIIESVYGVTFNAPIGATLHLPKEANEVVTDVNIILDEEEITCIVVKNSSTNYDLTCVNSQDEEFKLQPIVNR